MVATLEPEWLRAIIAHAIEGRSLTNAEREGARTIEIESELFDRIQSSATFSSK